MFKLFLCKLYECVSSNSLLKKMIYHKIHICDLCGLHELCGCVSLNILLCKMIYHKIRICNLCGLHELCICDSSNVVLEKMIYHKIHISNFCGLHILYGLKMYLQFVFIFENIFTYFTQKFRFFGTSTIYAFVHFLGFVSCN